MNNRTLPIARRAIALAIALLSTTAPLQAGSCCSTAKPMSCCPELQSAAPTLTANSLYQVGSTWTNQQGNTVPLASLSGKPQLIALAYTNCQYACPRLLADLKAIESQLPEGPIGITIISIDPQRDTPARLQEYATEQNLDSSRWTLLHGDSGDVLELANLLGVRYQKTPNGEFSHSNIITLLDAKGEIAHQQSGLGADNAPTLAKISELMSSAASTTVAKTSLQ